MKPSLNKLIGKNSLLNNLGKIGIVTNQTSTTSSYQSACEIINTVTHNTHGSEVTCVFGPQHGYYQTEQDNMKETSDLTFEFLDGKKVPLFSLYSNTREPTPNQLQEVDTLVLDLQDIGCRVYTYMLTLAGCLRSCARVQKKVVVLDRINPLGLSYKTTPTTWKYVEGNTLNTQFMSFVGWYEIPMRHGLTMGELGHLFIHKDKLDVEYKVIRVDELTRQTSPNAFKYSHWAMPSPNIPSWKSAFLFPSFVSLEGTNVSEGRGSTIPFELVGAPWLNTKECIQFLHKHEKYFSYKANQASGIVMREHQFRPTFNKYKNEICKGIQFHVDDAENAHLFSLGILFLYFCAHFHPQEFQWAQPGYEYNFSDMPINLILGHDKWLELFNVAKEKDNLLEIISFLNESNKQAQNFMNEAEPFFMY